MHRLTLRHIAGILLGVILAGSLSLLFSAIWIYHVIDSQSGLETTVSRVLELPSVRREFSDSIAANAVSKDGRRVLRDAPAIYAAADLVVTSPEFAESTALAIERLRISSAPDLQAKQGRALFKHTLSLTRPDLAAGLSSDTAPLLDATTTGLLRRSLVAAHRFRLLLGCFALAAIGSGLGCMALIRRPKSRLRSAAAALLLGSLGVFVLRQLMVRYISSTSAPTLDRNLVLNVFQTASSSLTTAWIGVVWGAAVAAATMHGALARGRSVLLRTRRAFGKFAVRDPNTPSPVALTPAPSRRPNRRPETRARRWTALLVIATLGLLGPALSVRLLATRTSTSRVLRCAGSPRLCDRRFDQVVFAGTHNSMNNRADEFTYPEQEMSIDQQLKHGIRGFLIDTHYGKESTQGRVWTDLTGVDRATLVRNYGEAAVVAGEEARKTLVEPTGQRGLYLCHDFCELGATRLIDALTTVRSFLETNPTEVIVLFIQDQTSPKDTMSLFTSGDLAEVIYTPPGHGGWPTMRTLLTTDRRLIVMSEKRGVLHSWYERGFDRFFSDTSYSVSRVAGLRSCTPNRGPVDAPLLLMNHWIQTFPSQPRDAAVANAQRFIVERAKECQRERGRLPNIIAVNWAETGDVVNAVAELNNQPS